MYRSITDIVKYLAALVVVNGHLFVFFSDYTAIASWVSLGSQCVSLFLFFSGYGLMCAYENKGDSYLHGFFFRRIVRVLIPLITAYIVTLPLYSIFRGPIDWKDVLATIYFGGEYLKFSWYVTEIFILYLIFYVCVFVFKNNVRYVRLNLTVSVCVLMIILAVIKFPIWWLLGLPCFVFGVWYKYLNNVQNTKWIGIMSVVLFIISFRWQDVASLCASLNRWRYQYIAYYISNIAFVSFIVYIIRKIQTKIEACNTHKIFNSYYEIYLMQNCCFIIVGSLGLVSWLMIPVSLCVVVIVGYVMNRINNRLFMYLKMMF